METRHRAAGIMAESITYRQSPAANPLSRRRVPATLICPKATEPPSGTLRMGQPTTPAGGPEHPMPLISIHPAFRCSIQGRVRFPGRFQDSAVKCSVRPRIYCSPTRCFGACGTAARRLPGTPVGDTPPFASVSGVRDGKARQWTERPGHSAAVTSSDFEYLVIPSSSAGQRT